jgi:thiol-disulfide isomerase/thioredoxin
MLITYSAWCILGKGEIPAINELAKDYKDKIQIIVVFWNKKSDAKHIAKKFSKDIMVCYANESERKDSQAMMYLKKPLGFPTAYMINENKVLVDIKKSFVKPENKIELQRSAEFFYKKYSEELSLMIVTDKFKTSKFASF